MPLSRNLISKFGLISEQVELDELALILDILYQRLESGIEGDVCEFGCFAGTTSLFLARVMQSMGSKKMLYLYDSFEGLPVKSLQDQSALGEEFVPGELMAAKSQLKLNFKKANLSLRRVKIKKAWFNELERKDLPKKICFAFLDGDFYESIKDCLTLIQEKMEIGGVIIVDDYHNPALPGAKLAVDEFLLNNAGYRLCSTQKSLAVIERVR